MFTRAQPAGQKIWIVDDDAVLRSVVSRLVTESGYEPVEIADGADALERWAKDRPALIVLDVNMERLDGWSTLKALREAGCEQPILMLTGVADVASRVRGLEHGADDYLVKPFSGPELLARVLALLRRVAPPASPEAAPLQIGAATIDLGRKTATRDGAPLKLTRTEFVLLQLLSTGQGMPVSRATILGEVWGGSDANSHTLDTHLWRLRKKLGDDGTQALSIQNISGVGFALRPASA